MDLSLTDKQQKQAGANKHTIVPFATMAKPSLMPKPILHDRTTMKLRVNFPSADGTRMEELTEKDLANVNTRSDINNTAVTERRNSKLMSEGVARAMGRSAGAPAVFDSTEETEDLFPDASSSWITETARRDSIEQTRKKMGSKGIAAVSKGRNQRLRRGLRETRRSTGVAMFDEMSSPVYQADDENRAHETKTNTARNEINHHQLLQQTSGPSSGRMASNARTLYRIESQPDANQYFPQRDGQNNALNIDQNGSYQNFEPSLPHQVELENQLSALVKGLHVSSHRS